MVRNPFRNLAGSWRLVVALALPCLLVSCGRQGDVSPAVPASATNEAPVPVVARPEFDQLKGRWERPDGGYVLEFRNVDTAGVVEAAYFNPGPIRVSKALALQEQGTTKVFVELRDVNYPGCTYSLSYDPATDQLHGVYFQAAVQQTYDVVFARLK